MPIKTPTYFPRSMSDRKVPSMSIQQEGSNAFNPSGERFGDVRGRVVVLTGEIALLFVQR